MKTVIRLMFIVCVAVFFASNVFADTILPIIKQDVNVYFLIKNHTHLRMDVSVTGNKYCVFKATPSKCTIMPGDQHAFDVDYSKAWFWSTCSVHHSSQDFNVTFILANKKQYSTTLTWYKPYRKGSEILTPKIPKIPGHEHLKVKVIYGSFIDKYPTVTFSE